MKFNQNQILLIWDDRLVGILEKQNPRLFQALFGMQHEEIKLEDFWGAIADFFEIEIP